MRRTPTSCARCGVILSVVAAVGLSGALGAVWATSKPKAKAPATEKAQDKKVVKYKPVTKEQAAANRKRAIEMGEKTRTFAPNMHMVETAHCLIFTEWDRSNDKPLAEICERMYRALSRQFDIPPKQNIWAGKCPIFIFWEKLHFVQFTQEVDRKRHASAAAYHVQHRGGFCYIVMNRCEKRERFFEWLVHEATHAFLGRYMTNRRVPIWLNEGLAEYMAATLVPECNSAKEHEVAAKRAVKEKRDVRYVLKSTRLDYFGYGIAQSIVRFMIARDRRRFIRFVQLLKEGKKEDEALKLSYGLTQEQLVRGWEQAVTRMYGKRR